MSIWSLNYNGGTKRIADWHISNLSRRAVSLSVSTVSFDVAAEFDAEDVFAYGETVTIFQDVGDGPVQWFVGRVDQTPRTANGRYEGHGYVLVDAWWHLENLVYQYAWKELTNPLDPAAGLSEKLSSHLILNLTNTGLIITTKAQITAVLQYAIDSFEEGEAPFRIGTIDLPDVYPPTSEVLDRMCSEVVLNQLRWTPDAVGYFDHSTRPPTLHIKQRSALTRVTVPVSGITDLQIRPRYDLEVPAVVIKYRRTNLVNGVAYYQQEVDAMPEGATGREVKSLLATIDLEGSQVDYTYAEIVTAPIDIESPLWWAGQYAPLGGVANLEITDAARETNLPRELITGPVPAWLLAKQNATVKIERFFAKASYEVVDNNTVIEKRTTKSVHTEIRTTDLESGTYVSGVSASFGQPAPIGLANYLYQATSRLHFDGGFTLSEEECAGIVGLGNILCISGGRAEWAEMDAVVQSITESIDDGRTSVVFGPPKHLGADDIIEFLQATRNRIRFTSSSAMTTGVASSGGGGGSSAVKETPAKNSNADHGSVERLMIGKVITLDAAATFNRSLTVREVKYCDEGVEKYMLVLASGLYDQSVNSTPA